MASSALPSFSGSFSLTQLPPAARSAEGDNYRTAQFAVPHVSRTSQATRSLRSGAHVRPEAATAISGTTPSDGDAAGPSGVERQGAARLTAAAARRGAGLRGGTPTAAAASATEGATGVAGLLSYGARPRPATYRQQSFALGEMFTREAIHPGVAK